MKFSFFTFLTKKINIKGITVFLRRKHCFILNFIENFLHKVLSYPQSLLMKTPIGHFMLKLNIWWFIWTDGKQFSIANMIIWLIHLVPQVYYTTKHKYRLIQTKIGFYSNSRIAEFLKKFAIIFSALLNSWKFLKYWILPIFLSSLVYVSLLIFKVLPFNKVIFIWFSFFMVLYWLVSGFVFFFKKYQFGKYTSVIQRFWRRSYILFWLLESCLLFVFIYLTFIASQESFFMFDQIQIYKTHLFSWKLFLLKVFPVILIIIITYCLILVLKWNVFAKINFWLIMITSLLTYIIWIEFYQFFHIVNFYGNLTWVFDIEEKFWNLEIETRRTRIVNHYVMLLLILKFWHLLFVYGFWIFFILRGWEKQKYKYPLLSANYQNMIILYIMNWLYMFPWFKLYLKKMFNVPYYWFFATNKIYFKEHFFENFNLYIKSIGQLLFNSYFYTNVFWNIPFINFLEYQSHVVAYLYKKHFVKSNILDYFANIQH